MKTIMAFAALLCIGVLVAYRTYQSPPTTEVSVLRDITDTSLTQPDTAEILRLYSLDNDNKWNGAIFRFSNLTDVSLNKTSVTKIDAANKWLSNEIARGKEVKKFQDEISNILLDSEKDSLGKRNSSLYLPIANELARLSRSQAERRVLIVYSDLKENQLDVSFYRKNIIQLLKSNPDSLKHEFEKQKPLPVLDGIEVYLIYQPGNAEQDREYKVYSDFYRKFIEEKGATVSVGASL